MRNRLLIVSVFIVASCGLAYELITGALASYLLGDSVLQFSSIIGCYLFAMGVGSHLSKYVKDERVLDAFIEIELLVGLIGGVSAAVLFLVFAWAGEPFRLVLYGLVFVIGVLVGMEIPLVMRAMNQRQASFSELVSQVLTFDYLGALAVSLLFPLVLAPKLGLSRSALLFGLLNAGVALWACRAFRHELRQPGLQLARSGVVLLLLAGGFLASDHLTRWSEKAVYGDEIIHAETTPYQRLVITKWKSDLRLYINGNLQFSSRDEHRYHEALVHPVLAKLPWARNVLVLGGGDGLAVREMLKYRNIQRITLVDLDPAMTRLFSRSEPLRALNQGSLTDPRVTVVNDDAARWLEQDHGSFDAVIVDFPDPSNFALGKLYSVPLYRLLARHLAENGLAVVQSTSPMHAPRSFWSVDATLRAAGLHTTPYHAYVPSFGEWGFIIAAKKPGYTPPERYSVPLRFLDKEATRQMFFFPPDMPRWKVLPNELNNQQLVHYFEQDWSQVLR
ncbi:polyamine aminopropyltransferase [Chromobacterium haemolyticum]|uniref:Polyamine aminopropyltransferase n=1 Tax=Chromobacterium haemolyticum TaxID=394935 RepID=A0A1W0CJW7_9NEIS|nr:polyamine aminopropyltransferase [Chromobacterium haemolyticum]OQS35074.1 spermidine synthase [Chromobacterium haemolyticum]